MNNLMTASNLEPLCDFEQLEMLRDLGMRESITRHTISLAKNWLYGKYGIWIETTRSGIIVFNSTANVKEHSIKAVGINPHVVESACLSECLKKLIDEKSNR
jgi:hypothetical protein